MRIACDTNVSSRTIRFLKEQGFDVCYKAGPGQPDKKWFKKALDLEVNVFISGDADIAMLVAKEYDRKIKFLLFPNLPYEEANEFLWQRLTKFKEMWGL